MKPAAYPRPIPDVELEKKILHIEWELKTSTAAKIKINKHPRDYTIGDVMLFLRENGRPHNPQNFNKLKALWFEYNYPIRRQPVVLETMYYEVTKRAEYNALRDSKLKS